MDKLYVPIALFPQPVQECIVVIDKIYFFVHFHSTFNVKRKPIVNNFDVLYYESISNPFLMCKTYFKTLCKIVYNFEMIKVTLYNSLNFYFEQKKTDRKTMTLFVLSLRHLQQTNKKISIYDFWYFCSNLHDSMILKFLLISYPLY